MTDPALMDDQASVDSFVSRAFDEEFYSLDTEFVGEHRYFPELALVQIATPKEIALIDPKTVDLSTLAQLLESSLPCYMFAPGQDLEILTREVGTTPRNVYDLQLAGRFLGYASISLSKLLESMIQVQSKKSAQVSNWLTRPLTKAQRIYAAEDVAFLGDLANKVFEKLARQGRMEWFDVENESQTRRTFSVPDERKAWWKIKGSQRLRGKARGVAQEVCAARELIARDQNARPQRVFSDLAAISIIQSMPSDLSEIRGLRGGSLNKEVSARILAAIERGQRLDESELVVQERQTRPHTNSAIIAMIVAYVAAKAAEDKIDASLLATKGDVEDYVSTKNGALASGWRFALIGSEIEKLLAGEASLTIRDKHVRLEVH